jgi:hypothetical protein
MISTVLQVALGFIIDSLYDPERKEIPWRDVFHWYFGKVLFLLAIINGYLGLREFAGLGFTNSLAGLTAGYWIVVGLGVSAFIYGEYKFGQTRKYTFLHKWVNNLRFLL